MVSSFLTRLVFLLTLICTTSAIETKNVGLGEFCGGIPPHPKYFEQMSKTGAVNAPEIVYICPPRTCCRHGACNCDDLPDGSMIGSVLDAQGIRTCQKVAERPMLHMIAS